jgi:hypothetical protein
MGLAKASVVMLYRRIDLYQNGRRWFIGIMLVIIAWSLFGIFALSFRCSGPHFWMDSPELCTSTSDILTALFITNIITDVFLIAFVVPGIWKLNMRKTMRIAVIALFSCRILCVLPKMNYQFLADMT